MKRVKITEFYFFFGQYSKDKFSYTSAQLRTSRGSLLLLRRQQGNCNDIPALPPQGSPSPSLWETVWQLVAASRGLVWQHHLCSSVPGHLPPCHSLLTCRHVLLLVRWTFHPISSYTWYCSPSSYLFPQVSKHISLCELCPLLCMCDSEWPCQLPWSHRQNSCTFHVCFPVLAFWKISPRKGQLTTSI